VHLALSLTQFWILADLYTNPGVARSHEDLMRAGRIVVEPNMVAVHVKAIRDEFRRIDAAFDRVATEHGRAYRWLPHGSGMTAFPCVAL
jgi:DNA-binding response OmpR family regulator